MNRFPSDWQVTTLGSIGKYLNGRAFKKDEWRTSGRPIIRIQNLTGTSKTFNYFDGELPDRYVVQRGDLLVSWAATLGAFVWGGPEAVLNQHIFKVESKIDLAFHRRLIEFKMDELQRNSHGSGMIHITKKKFDGIQVAVPKRGEQERLVELVEDHLSRLEAADKSLALARSRSIALRRTVLAKAIPEPIEYPATWRHETVGTVGKVELGRQRHPDWHSGGNMKPYLRVANVFEDRIDATDLMEMHWPNWSFEKFRLQSGDILLNEGQSPELIGRPAMYRGVPEEVAFTNSLIRYKASEEVLPEFALIVFRRHLHVGRFRKEARITTNIGHLSASRLKGIEFPVPSLAEQESIVQGVNEELARLERIERDVSELDVKRSGLRRAVLAAAFSGRLTGHRVDEEIIEELAEE